MAKRSASDVTTTVPAPSPERGAFVAQIGRQKGIVDKAALILELCSGRRVLDVGCINHSADVGLASPEAWLHHRIKRVAASVVGIDLLTEDAARLNQMGYRILTTDAQSFELDEGPFDVIVAADLIEHLTNVSGFLESARRHMSAASSLVLTTPNPFNFAQMMQVLLRGRVVVNAQHTVWFDPGVMFETLTREGFRITRFEWIDSDPEHSPETLATKALERASAFVGRLRPLARANYGVVAQLSTTGPNP